jgi:hypothetical protein
VRALLVTLHLPKGAYSKLPIAQAQGLAKIGPSTGPLVQFIGPAALIKLKVVADTVKEAITLKASCIHRYRETSSCAVQREACVQIERLSDHRL